MSQISWLQKSLRRGRVSVGIDVDQLHDSMSNRSPAIMRIEKLTTDHVKSLLESQVNKRSSAERMLICQLLVDLQTSFNTYCLGSGALYPQGNPYDGSYERNLASVLCQAGDYNGALALLHRISYQQIRQQDLSRIVQLGTALCARMKLIPEALGIGDDPMVSAVFECMDVLVLPYNLLAEYPSHGTGTDEFIKNSFMWPWIRRSIRAQLKDQPEAPIDWSATRLDFQFRDCFGHSFLHAAVFSQDDFDSWGIIRTSLADGQENAMARLKTTWPSYAQGFTPLASSVSSLAVRESLDKDNWESFDTLLSFSNRDLCCGSNIGLAQHKFCALAFAIRCEETEVVENLVRRSVQQGVDISDCCHWVMNWIPVVPLDIRNLLMAHLGIQGCPSGSTTTTLTMGVLR